MWTWIRMMIYAALGVASIGYGVYVKNVGAGNRFYRLWFMIGIVLFLLIPAAHWHLWGKLPRAVRIAGIAVFAVGLAVYAALMVRIAAQFGTDECETEYLIVLGAQMHDDGPSVILTYRLETAYEYLTKHPQTKCILSGGRGDNETISEAEGMRRYLTARGIDEGRLILEDRSRDTSENLRFSLELLPSPDVSVGIVTNNFHLYRALGIAEKLGYTKVCGVGASSRKSFLLHNMTREVVGVLKDVVMGNMTLH